MKPSGLTLLPAHSFLDASGDGWIFIDKRSPGVLESKCPYTVDGNIITDRSPEDIAEAYSSFFLEKTDHGHLKLKRGSRYYSQVQGEMAVMGCSWCHFVVWTKAGISIEESAFDPILWEEHMLPKLLNFYKRHVVPVRNPYSTYSKVITWVIYMPWTIRIIIMRYVYISLQSIKCLLFCYIN